MDTKRNTLSEDEIIEQARKAFGEITEFIGQPGMLLAALQEFSLNGCDDGSSGDTDSYGHFYRVHRWIVWTDSAGFHDIETYDNEDGAIKAFEKYEHEYSDATREEDGE
jgi:hypothetical protein